MTSVCRVKTERLQSHDALISKEFSSLASFTDDDSGSEKPLALESRNDVTKQFSDGVKNDPESSEFSIENILGISAKKQAAIARARVQAEKNNRSKWLLHASKSDDVKHIANSRKIKTSFPEERIIQSGLEASPESSIKTGNVLVEIKDDKSLGELCKKQKITNILKTMNGKNQSNFFFNLNQDGEKDKISKDGKLDSCLEQENTKRDQLSSEQLFANSAWVSAMNNYYGNVSPSWRMWQDLVFRRPLPTGTVHRQHPVFHPYMRRAQELGAIGGSSGGLNFPSFPLKFDFSKSRSLFPSIPQAPSPNDFQQTEEVPPRPNSSIEMDPSSTFVKSQADLNSFSGSSSPHGPLEADQNPLNFNSDLLRQNKSFVEIDATASKSRDEMGILSPGKESKFFSLENGPLSQNSTAPSSPRCPSGEEYSTNENTATGANVKEPSEGRSMNAFSEPRKKKTRTVFSRNQIFRLESTFEVKRYLSSSERASLASTLHLTETQIKIWFQNRRNKWKRQTASPNNEALCLGMGHGVVSLGPFNAISHPAAVGAQPQRRPPFLNPLSYNLSATACRPTGQYPPMGHYNIAAHRALFPWGSGVAKNDFYKLPPSAFQYYSQNMYAAMVASANADQRRSPDNLRIAGLDLSMPSRVQVNSENESDKTIPPVASTSFLNRMKSENGLEITSQSSNNADNPS